MRQDPECREDFIGECNEMLQGVTVVLLRKGWRGGGVGVGGWWCLQVVIWVGDMWGWGGWGGGGGGLVVSHHLKV